MLLIINTALCEPTHVQARQGQRYALPANIVLTVPLTRGMVRAFCFYLLSCIFAAAWGWLAGSGHDPIYGPVNYNV